MGGLGAGGAAEAAAAVAATAGAGGVGVGAAGGSPFGNASFAQKAHLIFGWEFPSATQ